MQFNRIKCYKNELNKYLYVNICIPVSFLINFISNRVLSIIGLKNANFT